MPNLQFHRSMESGAGAHALQDLSAHRSRPVNAKRRGVRNASSALAVKQSLSPNLRGFVLDPIETAWVSFEWQFPALSMDPHLTLTLSPPIGWERRGNGRRTRLVLRSCVEQRQIHDPEAGFPGTLTSP